LFYEVYALPYDYMGAFFSVGLVAPHPLQFYLPHLFFGIEPIQLLLASLSPLDDVFAGESDV
jgi:hypothetical protein